LLSNSTSLTKHLHNYVIKLFDGCFNSPKPKFSLFEKIKVISRTMFSKKQIPIDKRLEVQIYQGPKHTKKNDDFIFCLFWYAQQQNLYNLYKPVFLFSFFPCCCFGFISKVATTNNRQFIYDLSMLMRGS
jgi:hypothetical protein